MPIDEQALAATLARLEVLQQTQGDKLDHLATEIDKVKGIVWKMLLVAGGAAAGGSGLVKLFTAGSP